MPDSQLTLLSKSQAVLDRPILYQAYLDLSEFSKTQVVPASVMALGAFIAAVVTGQVTSVGSALLFILCSVVAGVLFYVLIAIVRAPFIVMGQHHRLLADVHQRLANVEAISRDVRLPAYAALSPPETSSKSVVAQMAASSFEFTNFVIVDRWMGEGGLTDDEPDDERDAETLKLQLMLARFYYKPERDVPPRIYVRAHLAIADSQGAPIQPRYDAVWDSDPINQYKEFETADTHALVIGLLPNQPGQGLCIYQYGLEPGGFSPNFTTLAGEEFVVHLDLIGKVNNVTVLNARMRFLLTLEPNPRLEFLG